MLDMVIGAKDPQPVIAFLKRLQESALFGDPTGHLFAPPSQNEPLYRYRVTVNLLKSFKPPRSRICGAIPNASSSPY